MQLFRLPPIIDFQQNEDDKKKIQSQCNCKCSCQCKRQKSFRQIDNEKCSIQDYQEAIFQKDKDGVQKKKTKFMRQNMFIEDQKNLINHNNQSQSQRRNPELYMIKVNQVRQLVKKNQNIQMGLPNKIYQYEIKFEKFNQNQQQQKIKIKIYNYLQLNELINNGIFIKNEKIIIYNIVNAMIIGKDKDKVQESQESQLVNQYYRHIELGSKNNQTCFGFMPSRLIWWKCFFWQVLYSRKNQQPQQLKIYLKSLTQLGRQGQDSEKQKSQFFAFYLHIFSEQQIQRLCHRQNGEMSQSQYQKEEQKSKLKGFYSILSVQNVQCQAQESEFILVVIKKVKPYIQRQEQKKLKMIKKDQIIIRLIQFKQTRKKQQNFRISEKQFQFVIFTANPDIEFINKTSIQQVQQSFMQMQFYAQVKKQENMFVFYKKHSQQIFLYKIEYQNTRLIFLFKLSLDPGFEIYQGKFYNLKSQQDELILVTVQKYRSNFMALNQNSQKQQEKIMVEKDDQLPEMNKKIDKQKVKEKEQNIKYKTCYYKVNDLMRCKFNKHILIDPIVEIQKAYHNQQFLNLQQNMNCQQYNEQYELEIIVHKSLLLLRTFKYFYIVQENLLNIENIYHDSLLNIYNNILEKLELNLLQSRPYQNDDEIKFQIQIKKQLQNSQQIQFELNFQQKLQKLPQKQHYRKSLSLIYQNQELQKLPNLHKLQKLRKKCQIQRQFVKSVKDDLLNLKKNYEYTQLAKNHFSSSNLNNVGNKKKYYRFQQQAQKDILQQKKEENASQLLQQQKDELNSNRHDNDIKQQTRSKQNESELMQSQTESIRGKGNKNQQQKSMKSQTESIRRECNKKQQLVQSQNQSNREKGNKAKKQQDVINNNQQGDFSDKQQYQSKYWNRFYNLPLIQNVKYMTVQFASKVMLISKQLKYNTKNQNNQTQNNQKNQEESNMNASVNQQICLSETQQLQIKKHILQNYVYLLMYLIEQHQNILKDFLLTQEKIQQQKYYEQQQQDFYKYHSNKNKEQQDRHFMFKMTCMKNINNLLIELIYTKLLIEQVESFLKINKNQTKNENKNQNLKSNNSVQLKYKYSSNFLFLIYFNIQQLLNHQTVLNYLLRNCYFFGLRNNKLLKFLVFVTTSKKSEQQSTNKRNEPQIHRQNRVNYNTLKKIYQNIQQERIKKYNIQRYQQFTYSNIFSQKLQEFHVDLTFRYPKLIYMSIFYSSSTSQQRSKQKIILRDMLLWLFLDNKQNFTFSLLSLWQLNFRSIDIDENGQQVNTSKHDRMKLLRKKIRSTYLQIFEIPNKYENYDNDSSRLNKNIKISFNKILQSLSENSQKNINEIINVLFQQVKSKISQLSLQDKKNNNPKLRLNFNKKTFRFQAQVPIISNNQVIPNSFTSVAPDALVIQDAVLGANSDKHFIQNHKNQSKIQELFDQTDKKMSKFLQIQGLEQKQQKLKQLKKQTQALQEKIQDSLKMQTIYKLNQKRKVIHSESFLQNYHMQIKQLLKQILKNQSKKINEICSKAPNKIEKKQIMFNKISSSISSRINQKKDQNQIQIQNQQVSWQESSVSARSIKFDQQKQDEQVRQQQLNIKKKHQILIKLKEQLQFNYKEIQIVGRSMMKVIKFYMEKQMRGQQKQYSSQQQQEYKNKNKLISCRQYLLTILKVYQIMGKVLNMWKGFKKLNQNTNSIDVDKIDKHIDKISKTDSISKKKGQAQVLSKIQQNKQEKDQMVKQSKIILDQIWSNFQLIKKEHKDLDLFQQKQQQQKNQIQVKKQAIKQKLNSSYNYNKNNNIKHLINSLKQGSVLNNLNCKNQNNLQNLHKSQHHYQHQHQHFYQHQQQSLKLFIKSIRFCILAIFYNISSQWLQILLAFYQIYQNPNYSKPINLQQRAKRLFKNKTILSDNNTLKKQRLLKQKLKEKLKVKQLLKNINLQKISSIILKNKYRLVGQDRKTLQDICTSICDYIK